MRLLLSVYWTITLDEKLLALPTLSSNLLDLSGFMLISLVGVNGMMARVTIWLWVYLLLVFRLKQSRFAIRWIDHRYPSQHVQPCCMGNVVINTHHTKTWLSWMCIIFHPHIYPYTNPMITHHLLNKPFNQHVNHPLNQSTTLQSNRPINHPISHQNS